MSSSSRQPPSVWSYQEACVTPTGTKPIFALAEELELGHAAHPRGGRRTSIWPSLWRTS
jgi:hypothetical protein